MILARYDGSGDAVVRFEGQTSNGPVSWASRLRFPERSRENPFVARLWATQRIGYLSAEKRKHGGSRELDDEIRELGERYGIPTEFSSYLVLEPGMNPQVGDARRIILRGNTRLDGVVTTGAASAPPAVAEQRFEAAKAASAQRAATNMAAVDSASGLRDEARLRRIGNRTMVLRDNVWTDAGFKKDSPVLRVKAFSDAYFRLIDAIPELREAFAFSDRLIVAGKSMAIELTPDGKDQINDRDLAMLRDRW